MGAVFSSAAIVAAAARAAKNYRQWRLIAPDAAADDNNEEYDRWSSMPDDLLFSIMARLDVQSIRRSGAVCTSWRHTHDAFNLAALEKAPCLLYACEEYGPNDLALYCPTTDATFRVPFPGQPHDKRGFTFSCPGGWVFTTDEVGDPYLITPLTGVQAKLPPVKTIYHNATWYDNDGRHVGERPSSVICWARHTEYLQVAISKAAKVTECTVLVVHMPEYRLSFARPGDTQWTLLADEHANYVCDILYHDTDGLFYILKSGGSISTVDLSEPSPKLTEIMRHHPVKIASGDLNMYLTYGPSGELLQVWRNWERVDTPRKHGHTYHEIVEEFYEDCVDLADEDDDGGELSEPEKDDEEDEQEEDDEEEDNKEEDDEEEDDEKDDEEYDEEENRLYAQLLREGMDLPHRLVDEVTTTMLQVFKVDIESQKLVELSDIGDYALFLGNSSSVCLSTKDFPMFESNCAYLADDCFEYSPMLRRDVGIWNIKKRSMQKLGDAWPNLHPWLHLPAPMWITPRF